MSPMEFIQSASAIGGIAMILLLSRQLKQYLLSL